MMGSLARASWTKIAICAGLLAMVVPLCWARNSMMTALAMGDDRAASLGVPVARIRLEMLACISLLAATATAFVGTIGFVGLVGPHIARMLVRLRRVQLFSIGSADKIGAAGLRLVSY
ncbi:FecCD transport family protein [Aminobacter sp. AP02]|nr:FecCD transport family protein [Aminobacter sp. AP02]